MSTSYTMVSSRMNTQRSRVSGVDLMKEAKAADENGVSCTKTHQFHHPTQYPMQMAPPHYHPPHQYPHGQFPGYPMYPMMPYPNPHPQVYGYHHHHQYHPHMNASMMRRPYSMTPALAKPHTSSAPPDISSSRTTPNEMDARIKDRSSALIGKKSEETSHQIKPTVSVETLASDAQPVPVVVTKDKGTMSDSYLSVKKPTSVESEADTVMLKQQSKLAESDAKVKPNVMNEKKHRTVSSSSLQNEGAIPPSQNDTYSILPKHDSTLSVLVPQNEKSDTTLGEIDSLAFRCANTNKKDREGVESLLLLSRAAENVRSSEDEAEKSSIQKQKSEHNKPLKKRKLQLPMYADRKEEGPLPKRKLQPPPQRTPAFFHFLLHHKEAIEKTIFSAEDTSFGFERSEMVAKEGAMWWMASSEEEKQRWATISTQNHNIL